MPSIDSLGWYGKLPSLGDFASRRLDADFIEAWDAWLAQGLSDWQARAPESWLDRYLAGPSWRFVLMPGVLSPPCADTAWAGVLMPSVDRVGRYFPLTLAQPLAHLPADGGQAESLLGWLQQLDDLAVDALHDDWSIEQIEIELQRIGDWQVAELNSEPTPKVSALRQPMSQLRPAFGVGPLMGGLARELLLDELRGKALWLSADLQSQPVLRVSIGLPLGGDFSDLLIGADAPVGDLSTVLSPLQPL